MFLCALLCVHPGFAIISMGKREMVALLCLSSWCLVMVERLFLAVPRCCLQFVIVVFPDHTHLLFLLSYFNSNEHNLKMGDNSDMANSTMGHIVNGVSVYELSGHYHVPF